MEKKLSDTWTEIAEAIEALEGRTDEMGRLRRVQLTDAAADFWYGMSDLLKQQGRNAEASRAHSIANDYWGRVVSDLDKSQTD